LIREPDSRVACADALGESVMWDARDGSVCWTDIEGRRVHRMRGGPDHVATFDLPDRPCFVLPRSGAGYIVGLPDRIAVASQRFDRLDPIAEIETDIAGTRVNDAAVDPGGGIVFGTYDEQNRLPIGAFYRLSPDGKLRKLLGGIATANGLAFSPDGATMYLADSAEGTIRRLDLAAGFDALRELPPLAGPGIADGKPDGAIVDGKGGYWSARVWGGCVVRIDNKGRLTDRIDLPVKAPTCVALGGPDMKSLYVTSLRIRHTEAELRAMPMAGDLLEYRVSVAGCAPNLASV
jgi:sugar lactone lactonase YvrE